MGTHRWLIWSENKINDQSSIYSYWFKLKKMTKTGLKWFNYVLKLFNADGTEISICFNLVSLWVALSGKEVQEKKIYDCLCLLELQVQNSPLDTVPRSFFHLQQSTLYNHLPYNLEI